MGNSRINPASWGNAQSSATEVARQGHVVCLCVRVAQGEDLTPGTGVSPVTGPYLELVPENSDKAGKPLSAHIAASWAVFRGGLHGSKHSV